MFVGTVCGDLRSPRVCRKCKAAQTRAACTPLFWLRAVGRAMRCTGMRRACQCSCPAHTSETHPARVDDRAARLRARSPSLRLYESRVVSAEGHDGTRYPNKRTTAGCLPVRAAMVRIQLNRHGWNSRHLHARRPRARARQLTSLTPRDRSGRVFGPYGT